MDPGLTNMGQLKRTYTLQELRALLALGYQFNPAYLNSTSINGADQNGPLINSNTPPYSDDFVGYFTGDSPSWPDYEITVHGTINNCDDFIVDLSARPELHDDQGDPIRVFPNSLYNIRGCGDGGNNHLQLALNSTPAGDVITFTPRPNFYGRAQFGFHLWDGHELGDFVVYTVEVLRDACFQCPSNNLALNGDYEEGTEVALLNDETVINSVLRDGKEGRLARGLHFSDGHPRNDQSTTVWIGFFGGGSIVDDCVRDCPTPTPLNDGFGLHSVEVGGPPGPVDHPPAFTGSRYNVLGFWNNGSLLCQDLENCHRYRLSFNVNFDESAQVPLTQYPLLIGFADDVQDLYFHPYPYNYSFNTSIPVPSAGTGWHQFVVEFDYCGLPSSLLNIEAPENFSNDNQVYMDDVVLVEIPAGSLQVNAGDDAVLTPSCGVAECLQLQGSALPGNGCAALNYQWSPTVGLSDPNIASPMACPLSTTTYSLTVTDACGNTGIDEVIISVTPEDCFTLTKTVSTTNTYAGAPVLYTFTVCNNTDDAETVILDEVDLSLTNFVVTSSTPTWNNFPDDPLSVPVPAHQCVTVQVAGHFTALGDYTNCVVAVLPEGEPLEACAEEVTVRQNCPLAVHGTGSCITGQVNMCMSVHSLITNIGVIEFDWVYPAFLNPPAQADLLTSVSPPIVGTWSFSSSSTISLPMTPPAPYDVYNCVTYEMVHVRLVFDTPPPFTTAGQWRMFCMQFGLTPGDVPAGMNTFLTMVIGSNGVHRTDLYEPDGTTEIHPGSGFLTQAANIILTGCPVPVDEEIAEFTVEVPHCGGLVSVQATNDPPGAIHMWTWGDERTTPINGAASHTYDYFAEITENTEWDFAGTIAAAPPGTYTITHTVILNGVASISTQTVTIYACCQADLVIEDGAMASTVGTNFSGTVAIQGQFNVDVDVTFSNAEVFMEPGSEIILQDGKNLWVNESTLQSCQDVLWKGITTGTGCIVQVRSSMIADAESGVRAMNSSIVLVDESEFKNNRVGIEVPEQGGFNSVAIHSANSTYHAQGPLKQPYPGQTTVVGQKGYAALDLNDMSLDFSGGNNVIHRLSNGIVGNGCDLYVNDCSIQNIQPDAAYLHHANGSGIYARGPKAFRSLKQYGYGQSGAPSFQNCHWGIYAEHMNVYSWDNNMVNVGTAYRVDRSGYKDVHIHHNTLDTRRDGIVLHMNDGAAQVLVEDNDITFAQNLPIGQYTKGYYAIRVFEANTLNPNSVIKNNIIHYRPGVTTAYGGIGLVSARKYLVANNALHMSDNASNYVGVLLNGCDDPEVSCNEVFGANNGYPNLGQSGVRNFMGNNAIISCNTVDNTTNGMLFSGWAINTDLKGNEFNNHRWGLHLEDGAVIGTQTRTGNLWIEPAPQNGHQAWHENAADAAFNRFWYDPSVPNTLPPSREPLYWFQIDPGLTYSCAPGVNYCDQFGERCVGCPKEIYERIADGTLENGDYTDQTRWTMKGDLYDILKEAPELRNDPELEAFYNTVQSTVLAAQKDMNDERIALYDIDASVLGQVVQNREQLLVLQGELKLALEQLAAPDLTTAQRTTLNGVITGLQQTMDGLVTYNNAALELAANTRALSAESVKNTNAAIGATELTETNYKTVNAIYLSTVAKDVEGFTAQQAQDLLAVADQCPLIGGNAVFQARALYYAIDPEQEFDDPALCLQHGLVTKSLKQPVVNALNMVPNPAMDEVTLVLTSALEEAGTLLICNAQGAEVLRLRVPKDQQRTAVSVATLAHGVYHYRVLGVTGDLGAGKLSIVR
ncbi:MAG TPA: hypothetical protein PLL25_12015 [Flavobacteriales bacterium]|nr:hypothetical protein [Flavobacteriales bacterium]